MSHGQQQSPLGNQIPEDIVEQAIDWAIKIHFNIPDNATRKAFDAWLQSDARHAKAWQQMDSIQKGFDVLPGQDIINILETVEQKSQGRKITRRKAIKTGLLGGIFLMAAGWGAFDQFSSLRESMTATTLTGGRRTLEFSEGTRVEMNTASSIIAQFTPYQRSIRLLRGEVLITTGKDDKALFRRPFVVNTSFGSLEALGTQFCVRIMPDHVRICVLEDAVRISAAGYNVTARAKETWQAGPGRVFRMDGTAARATDWLNGIIVAKGMPLSELLGELSRYRPGGIDWDTRVANLKAFGIYQVNQPDKALEILSQTLPIKMSPLAGNAMFISYVQK